MWAACRKQALLVFSGSFLSSLLMPLESLFWEEDVIVCLYALLSVVRREGQQLDESAA